MPRTETCTLCSGIGAIISPLTGTEHCCPRCGGNGYVTENDEVAPLIDPPATEPAPKRMANRTWRLLEEMRQVAQEAIEECNAAEATPMAHKRADALATLRICDAGQAALEGEV